MYPQTTNNKSLTDKILKLKKEKNAIILAHYYVNSEVQDIADYIGDSLGLSQMAGRTDAKIILFAGVQFMAETAAVISQEKIVLLPDPTAGCSLAESINASDIIEWRKFNKDGIVVSYVNTTADVKAETDICCTSANALDVINSIPKSKKILFTPDKNLGSYIKAKLNRDMDVWSGDCCVHEEFSKESVLNLISDYPDAHFLIHPESSCSHDPEIYNNPKVHILSTTGMIKKAGEIEITKFVVVTEPGVIHQMKMVYPQKEFIPADPKNKCFQMRKVTLEKILFSLENECYKVEVNQITTKRARPSITKMLEL